MPLVDARPQKKRKLVRFLVEPGQRIDLVKISGCDNDSEAMFFEMLYVIPAANWVDDGRPDIVTVHIGDRPQFEAPVEALKMWYQRLKAGGSVPFGRPLLIPPQQNAVLTITHVTRKDSYLFELTVLGYFD